MADSEPPIDAVSSSLPPPEASSRADLTPATAQTPATGAVPVQREQREKKESLKKREASSAAPATTLGKRKASHASATYPSPQRFNIPPPRALDFEPPKDDMMTEHEPVPIYVPGQDRQMYKPVDLAENKRGYRYQRAIADPLFPHKQYYRSTSPPPHCARMSFEDADKWMHFSTNALFATNEKGWRMARANVCAREGTLYYEIKIHRGVPQSGLSHDVTGPEPHVRFGWARREAPLDAPVGFDGYSYGITDVRFETMHRSRPGKFFSSKKVSKSKGAKTVAASPTPVTLSPEDQHVKEGDIIGVEIQLPSLGLHQKIVSGVYNPAVDIGDGFDDSTSSTSTLRGPDDPPADVIRDRIPVAYKGNSYFEVLDLVSTRPMETYADRTTSLTTLTSPTGAPSSLSKEGLKSSPSPNHEQIALRTLPHSAVRVYKNSKLIGTAFENLLAFLPPASQPSKQQGAREDSLDDGMIGYFPAVSCFFGGIAEINFGDSKGGFWAPPPHLRSAPLSRPSAANAADDVEMPDAGANGRSTGPEVPRGWNPGGEGRAVGERYKEQVAEDVTWDIIDEVDFFMQDGGFEGRAGQGGGRVER